MSVDGSNFARGGRTQLRRIAASSCRHGNGHTRGSSDVPLAEIRQGSHSELGW